MLVPASAAVCPVGTGADADPPLPKLTPRLPLSAVAPGSSGRGLRSQALVKSSAASHADLGKRPTMPPAPPAPRWYAASAPCRAVDAAVVRTCIRLIRRHTAGTVGTATRAGSAARTWRVTGRATGAESASRARTAAGPRSGAADARRGTAGTRDTSDRGGATRGRRASDADRAAAPRRRDQHATRARGRVMICPANNQGSTAGSVRWAAGHE
jgi:hypothetical protein